MTRDVAWIEQPLTRRHDRAEFDCGVSALNEYLQRYARQNHESGGAKTFVAKTFVAVPSSTSRTILGYYTISPGAMAFAEVPAAVTKRLGRYEVPVFRLGRLAVALAMQGEGLGGELLLAAGARALAVAQEVGGVALAIDAKDDRAAAWDQRFGVLGLGDDLLKLILPLDTIAAALKN